MQDTLKVSTSDVPVGFPPLVRARLTQLGLGRTVMRAHLETVCRGHSAANHFLDKATHQGLLVPVKWGEYRVADAETVALLARMPLAAHQRLVSWARLLPKLTKRRVAFLAPRVWMESDLHLEELAPILGLEAREESVSRPTPQWGAFMFDLGATETWRIQADEETVGTLEVPSLWDSVFLARSIADPRWRSVAAAWKARLPAKDAASLIPALATVRRIAKPNPFLPINLGPGPPVRRRLVTPAWFEELHRDALETVARGLDD